jgi:hypothetical protein
MRVSECFASASMQRTYSLFLLAYVYEHGRVMQMPVVHIVVFLLVVLGILARVGTRYTRFIAKIVGKVVQESMRTSASGPYLEGPEEDWGEAGIEPAFNAYQTAVLDALPTTLEGALRCMDLNGEYIMYAACPVCNFTNRELPSHSPIPSYPTTCQNVRVGDQGRYVCGAELLKPAKPDARPQPIKPYAVASLKDYLARTMADPDVVKYSNKKWAVSLMVIL